MQTYIQNKCSIFGLTGIDIRTYIRYNSIIEQMYVTHVRLRAADIQVKPVLLCRGRGRKIMNNQIREEKIRQNRSRRAKQLKRHVVMLIGAAAVLCAVLVAALCMSVKAAGDEDNRVKCYKSVMVGYGESLEDLSEDNYDPAHYDSAGDYSDEVVSINNIKDGSVRPGQYIVILTISR
jgi:hypothetical protein